MAARKKKATRKKTTTRRKKTTRRASARSKAVASLVVNSKVKETIKGHGVRMAGDFGEALNAKMHEIIAAAVARCAENGRGTVRPYDL